MYRVRNVEFSSSVVACAKRAIMLFIGRDEQHMGNVKRSSNMRGNLGERP